MEIDLNGDSSPQKVMPEEFKSERGFDTLMGDDNSVARPYSPTKSIRSGNGKISKSKSLKRTRTVKAGAGTTQARVH